MSTARTKELPPSCWRQSTNELSQQYEPVWHKMQIGLAELSTNGELVIVEDSDRHIQLEQLGAVVDVPTRWLRQFGANKLMTDESGIYAIKVKGHLDDHWSEWFEGLAMVHDERGNTILTGLVPDQAALHGLLIRIRNLGLPLLAVERIEEDYG